MFWWGVSRWSQDSELSGQWPSWVWTELLRMNSPLRHHPWKIPRVWTKNPCLAVWAMQCCNTLRFISVALSWDVCHFCHFWPFRQMSIPRPFDTFQASFNIFDLLIFQYSSFWSFWIWGEIWTLGQWCADVDHHGSETPLDAVLQKFHFQRHIGRLSRPLGTLIHGVNMGKNKVWHRWRYCEDKTW